MKKTYARLALAIGLPLLGMSEAGAQDVINLEGTFKGNREQPKVLYIVPWQSPGSTVDLEKPLEGELQGLFQPMDRSSFRRELKYYKLLSEDGEKSPDKGLLE